MKSEQTKTDIIFVPTDISRVETLCLTRFFLFGQFWPIDVFIDRVVSGIIRKPLQHRIYKEIFSNCFFHEVIEVLSFDWFELLTEFRRFVDFVNFAQYFVNLAIYMLTL